jgi:hypothetical protein
MRFRQKISSEMLAQREKSCLIFQNIHFRTAIFHFETPASGELSVVEIDVGGVALDGLGLKINK